MSAAFLVFDVLIAAIVLRYVLPELDEQTSSLVLIIGVIAVVEIR